MEDKRADSEFKQVTCVPVNVIGFYFDYLSPVRCKFLAGLLNIKHASYHFFWGVRKG